MRVINKTEQITALQNRDKSEREIAIQETLTAYRSTPHPATGVTPYQAMQNREIRTKLDYKAPEAQTNEMEMKINTRDAEYKRKMKEKKENRNFRENQFILGDYVLVKQSKRNKWSTAYEPTFYNVTRIDGSKIKARRVTDGRIISQDASHFKLANSVIDSRDDTGNVTMKRNDTNNGRMKTEEICEDRQVLERRKEDIKIRAGESEKDIAHEDEPKIMEEHEEELPPPETMEKEETSSQRPERKPETVRKGHQDQEEQQEDPSVMTISLQISRDNFDDVKLYF